jgi:hypothetical protein
VPADDKLNARLVISGIILDVVGQLRMEYPKATKERIRELRVIRKNLMTE